MNLGAQLVFLKLWLLSILIMYVGATGALGYIFEIGYVSCEIISIINFNTANESRGRKT